MKRIQIRFVSLISEKKFSAIRAHLSWNILPKNRRNKDKGSSGTDKVVTTQFRSLYFAHLATLKSNNIVKGTQDWEFFWLRFWNLHYFFVSNVKILRFYKKYFLIGPLLGEVRFFRVVLGLRGMKKKFELGQTKFFFFLQLWTLNMTQY